MGADRQVLRQNRLAESSPRPQSVVLRPGVKEDVQIPPSDLSSNRGQYPFRDDLRLFRDRSPRDIRSSSAIPPRHIEPAFRSPEARSPP
jgi:hypothetical protein